MDNLEKAKQDPSSQFKSPHDVVTDKVLSREQKIDILRRWSYDAREIAVAEEENMIAQGNDKHHILLEQIQKCLLELGVSSDDEGTPPTKQG